MPLDQMGALVGERADEVLAMLEQKVSAQSGAVPMAEPGIGGVTPELVQAATAVLVGVGLLQQATSDVTPEVLAALQEVVDVTSPGLFDLSNPTDMAELLNGIRTGTIPIGDDGSRGAAPGPGFPAPDLGAGLPGGGPLPGGLPGGGLPGAGGIV